MPYILVWFEPADAHVHLSVPLAGFTPGLVDVLGVPVHPLNLSPPGVCFVCESAAGLLLEEAEEDDCVFACAAAFACAVADAFAFGPAADSSAFFAWPLFSVEVEAEAEAVTLAED